MLDLLVGCEVTVTVAVAVQELADPLGVLVLCQYSNMKTIPHCPRPFHDLAIL